MLIIFNFLFMYYKQFGFNEIEFILLLKIKMYLEKGFYFFILNQLQEGMLIFVEECINRLWMFI